MWPLLAVFATFSALASAQTPATWQEALARGQWTDAEPLLKTALAETETAPVLKGLATVYRATGRLEAAEPIVERLVELDGSAANIEDLARVETSLGHLDRAEALYRSALVLRADDPAASIPVRARLAQVLLAEKKFPDAAVTLEAVAAMQANAFGDQDLRIADTLDSLADCRVEMQLVDPAVDALRRALTIRELNLGPSTGDVAATTDHLGKLLYSAKRFGDAEMYFQRTLKVYLKLLGPDSPELGRAYDNLAVTEAMLEKYVESEALYREALKLRDADDALSLRNLALVLTAQKKISEAQPLYSRALAVLDANTQSSDLLPVILTEYADLLRDLKRPAEAARLDQRLKGGKQVPQGKRAPVAAKQ